MENLAMAIASLAIYFFIFLLVAILKIINYRNKGNDNKGFPCSRNRGMNEHTDKTRA